MAASAETLERVYAIEAMPRLHDLLASRGGSVRATFAFAADEAGRPRVDVTVHAVVELECQRCMLPFGFPVRARTQLDLVTPVEADGPGGEREMAVMKDGMASLLELAEEEVLLALPLAPACAVPERGRCASMSGAAEAARPVPEESLRPFGALQDLLKNFDRT